MDANALLTWARETGFSLALAVFLLGTALRLFELFSLRGRADLSPPRSPKTGSGWRTIVSRSVPHALNLRYAVTLIPGYLFHVGLLVTLVFYRPHIVMFKSIVGLSWPSLPSALVDAVTVMSLLALGVIFINRLVDPVKRFLSTSNDWLALFATTLPILTGYLAYHHLFLSYTMLLALHILSVELLLVVLPFTKLSHAFTLFIARWLNGEAFARRGVAS